MKPLTLKIITRQLADPVPPARGEETGLTLEEEDAVMDRLLGPTPEPQELDTMELVTEAFYEESADGTVKLCYPESELTGMEGSVTTLSFRRDDPGLVTVSRAGAFSSVIVLEKQKIHSTLYEMPGAALEMKVHTLTLENAIGDARGSLQADYVLRIGGEITLRNRLTVEIMGK